jgi:hypothetical protein
MRKLVYGVVAACLSTTPVMAFDPPFVWVGQMVLVDLADCGGGGSNAVTIIFRPKLRAGEENSTLSYLFNFASGTVRKNSNTPQFNGSGQYVGSFVTGFATMRTNTGTFNLDVKPEVVTPTTKFVRFTGSFTNFVGVDGCTATVRGSASRLDRPKH